MADMVAKGRSAKGVDHSQAKLNDASALAIYRSPEKQQTLADRYGVHQVTVSHIKRGITWRHVTQA